MQAQDEDFPTCRHVLTRAQERMLISYLKLHSPLSFRRQHFVLFRSFLTTIVDIWWDKNVFTDKNRLKEKKEKIISLYYYWRLSKMTLNDGTYEIIRLVVRNARQQ